MFRDVLREYLDLARDVRSKVTGGRARLRGGHHVRCAAGRARRVHRATEFGVALGHRR